MFASCPPDQSFALGVLGPVEVTLVLPGPVTDNSQLPVMITTKPTDLANPYIFIGVRVTFGPRSDYVTTLLWHGFHVNLFVLFGQQVFFHML